MDDSQSESQSQPRAQQHRTRSRITADGQTSRRPRAVAGQRAAAKRAGQPVQQPPVQQHPVQSVPQQTVALVQPATESVVVESDSEPASSPAIRKPSQRQRTRTITNASTSSSTQTRSVRRAVVTAVLAVALIAAVAIGAVLTFQYRDAIRTDHARIAAMAAAKRAAPVIFSYDYRHLDQDFSKAEALLTGSFRDQYTKTTQTVVKPTALQYHGVVKATVAQPGDGSSAAVSVVSASPDQVVVLAFIDQSTTSTRVSGTQVDQNRVLLTLTHTSQGWLVSAVDAL